MSADPRDVIARQLWAEQKDVDAFLSALSAAGWVVVPREPGDAPYIHTGRDERTTEYANGHYDGWDACLAAVRAAAVKVE